MCEKPINVGLKTKQEEIVEDDTGTDIVTLWETMLYIEVVKD